jgi:hypothetical protein
MLKLPSWFTRPKQDKPASSEEIAAKLKAAEEAHAAAQLRVETARATLAAVRDDAALKAVSTAKSETEEAAEMLAILRKDHADALEHERQEHLAQVRVQRDAARVRRGEHIARETEVANAAALALVEGWVTLHRARETELRAACEADHDARRLSAELGENEADLHLSVSPSDTTLAGRVIALGATMPGADQALLHGLVVAVAPGYHHIASMVKRAENSERLAEQSHQRNRENPPQPAELQYIDPFRRARGERPSMAKQMSDALEGKAG